MKLILLTLTSLFFVNVCVAQLEESVHQSFEIDSLNSVIINLKGDVEVQTWAGNTVLTETKVKLYDASQGILNYFVKLGRYEIELKKANGTLSSKDIIRRPIRTKKGECFEEAKVYVFLPDDFEAESDNFWKRKTEETTNALITTDSLAVKDSLNAPKIDTISNQVEDNH